MLVILTAWSLHFSNSLSLHKRWLDLETDTALSLLEQNSFFRIHSSLMTPSLSVKNRYSPHPLEATTGPDAAPLLWGQNFVINDNDDDNYCSFNKHLLFIRNWAACSLYKHYPYSSKSSYNCWYLASISDEINEVKRGLCCHNIQPTFLFVFLSRLCLNNCIYLYLYCIMFVFILYNCPQ